jgi:hypothetical protein
VFTATYTNGEGKASTKDFALAYPYNPASNMVWVSTVKDGKVAGKPYKTRLDRWALVAA